MRVPRGSPAGVITTAAFSSNRSTEPSGRRIGLCVRTTTARTTSPFFTAAPGVACFTAATITSPTAAVWLFPFSTRIHRISRAPELSATRSRVYGRIIETSEPVPLVWVVPEICDFRNYPNKRRHLAALAGLLDEATHAPGLFLTQRAALHDLDE